LSYFGTIGTENESKIKKLLSEHRAGTVSLARWLKRIGISHDLQKKYRKRGWLESIGTGAFKRPDETISWQGGLYALQDQAKLAIYAGATTALSMQGLSHYIRSVETVFLFSPPKVLLPRWFSSYNCGPSIEHG
jgi:hypothetical protein